MPVITHHPEQVSSLIHAELAVVIPVYNEQDNISVVVEMWSREFLRLNVNYQFLLVNDGSTDSTRYIIETIEQGDPHRIIVINKTNTGHGRSCRYGYDAAVAASAVKWIFQIDSDGQCNPIYFKEFWSKRLAADCIFARRVSRADGLARTLTSKLCKIGARILGGLDLVDPNVPYRLIKKESLSRALELIPPSFDIHNVAVSYVLKYDHKNTWNYVPIRFLDRQGGSNSINVVNVAQLGISMLFDLMRLRKRLP